MANFLVFLISSWISIQVIGVVHCQNPLSSYEVLAAWKQLDYQFPSAQTRNRLLQTKEFIPENNVITGIKVYGNRVYLTVPRWRFGIPSTLNYIESNQTKGDDGSPLSPLLVPFPSWEMQEIGNCSSLQYIQSMEIDQWGRMWIVDVGRINIFHPTEAQNNCPAKLLIVDLNTNQVVHNYTFPANVVSPTNNFLNDIVVACGDEQDRSKCYAYITDARDSKLVIFNLKENRAWFVHHKTMKFDPEATNIPILGINYTFNVNMDGIALSPKDRNFDRVYYCPLSSYGLFSISTSTLHEAVNGVALQDSDVLIHQPPRSGQSDGLAMDSQGLLFYGLLPNNSVSYVNTSSTGDFHKEVLLVHNDADLQWPDTFAFDDKGYLYAVPNRLQLFSTNTLDWTEVNFRVVRVFIGSRSYMFSAKDKVSPVPPQVDSSSSVVNSPTNLDTGAPDQPVGLDKDRDIYKHHSGDDANDNDEGGNGNEWNTESDSNRHHSRQHGNHGADNEANGMDHSTNSAPTVNEQLPVILFLSVLMYNPALRP